MRIFDGAAAFKQTFTPFGSFSGGVSVGVLDIDGSGANRLHVGAGAGGGPHVRFFDGVTFEERKSLFAFDPGFRGGVFVG